MALEIAFLALLTVAVGALAFVVLRLSGQLSEFKARNEALSEAVRQSTETFSRQLIEQLGQNRQEAGTSGKQLREEVSSSVLATGESLNKTLEAMRETIQQRVRELQQDNAQKLD